MQKYNKFKVNNENPTPSDSHGKHHQLKDLPKADIIVHSVIYRKMVRRGSVRFLELVL